MNTIISNNQPVVPWSGEKPEGEVQGEKLLVQSNAAEIITKTAPLVHVHLYKEINGYGEHKDVYFGKNWYLMVNKKDEDGAEYISTREALSLSDWGEEIYWEIEYELSEKKIPLDEKWLSIHYDYEKSEFSYSFYSNNVLYKGPIFIHWGNIESGQKKEFSNKKEQERIKLEKKWYWAHFPIFIWNPGVWERFKNEHKEYDILVKLNNLNLPDIKWKMIELKFYRSDVWIFIDPDKNLDEEKIISEIEEYINFMPDPTKKYRPTEKWDLPRDGENVYFQYYNEYAWYYRSIWKSYILDTSNLVEYLKKGKIEVIEE